MLLRSLIAAGLIISALSPEPALARTRLEKAISGWLKPPSSTLNARGRSAKSSFPAEPRTCVKRDRLVLTPQGYRRRNVDVCS